LRIEGGRTTYGQSIGVLMLNTRFPRIIGDVGNAASYSFPVVFRTVEMATPHRVLKNPDGALLRAFVKEAKQLEKDGVSAITTSCGFLSAFQEELATELKVPVFTSTLMLVPLAARMLGRGEKVGIITADSTSLKQRHLDGAGIERDSVVIKGLERTAEFSNIGKNLPTLDPVIVEGEVVAASQHLIKNHPEVRTIVFECANLAPYSDAVRLATGLPVFDINLFLNFVHDTVTVGNRFGGKRL
jgi:Asp/Glu/Hydantoin racemase